MDETPHTSYGCPEYQVKVARVVRRALKRAVDHAMRREDAARRLTRHWPYGGPIFSGASGFSAPGNGNPALNGPHGMPDTLTYSPRQ